MIKRKTTLFQKDSNKGISLNNHRPMVCLSMKKY